MFNIRFLIIAFVCAFFGFTGYKAYSYFLTTTKPHVTIIGIQEGGYCAGDSTITLRGNSSYKVGTVSVWLDERPIINKYEISKSELSNGEFEFPITLPKTVPNGKHTIKIEVCDASYHKNKTCINRQFIVDNTPLQATLVRPAHDYKVFQGKTLRIQFQSNKELNQAVVRALSQEYECYPESTGSLIYECFIPVSCEESPNEYQFFVNATDYVGTTVTLDGKLQIVPFPFKKHTLHVNADHIRKEAEAGNKQQELEQELSALIQKSPRKKLWKGAFYLPIEMTRITCEYGTKRVTQEKGCYTHAAIDLIGTPKTVVWAPQDGIIVIKKRYASSGNTVVMDHGFGVFTLIYHLDSFSDIEVGDEVKRGNPIGKQGATGYAAGEHVHWEMRINNTQIDPMQWTKYDF